MVLVAAVSREMDKEPKKQLPSANRDKELNALHRGTAEPQAVPQNCIPKGPGRHLTPTQQPMGPYISLLMM